MNDVCIVLVQIGLKIDQTFTKILHVDMYNVVQTN